MRPAAWGLTRGNVAADRALRRAYWAEVHAERTPRHVRRTALAALVINVFFVPLDRFAFPELARNLLAPRVVLQLLLLVIAGWMAKRHPRASQMAAVLSISSMLLVLIHATGGLASDYYGGLLLVFGGAPLLLALSAGEAAALALTLLASFVGLGLLQDEPVDRKVAAIHLFVLSGAAFVSVLGSALADAMRFREFRQRRLLEQARDELQEVDRAKSRFVANVHHEFRTPLTLLLTSLEAVPSEQRGDAVVIDRATFESMHLNALRLLKLVESVLDVERIQSGRLVLRPRPVRVERLASEVVAGARPLAEGKRVRLETRGLGELPPLRIDPDALEKVLVNLVGNALKFTEPGGRVELRGARGADDTATLTVEDTGIGIPADALGRVFERFAQVDGSATRRHEGTGIGLSLARDLVEAHGGAIWAESAGPGRGARFHVRLPTAPGEAPEADTDEPARDGAALARWLGALEAELQRPRAPGGGPRAARERAGAGARVAPADAPEILVAEDHPEMQALLARVLEREFRVRTARDGREALEAIRSSRPDLVLADVMMPELSGLDLCRALKADPATRAIPFVLVTAKGERRQKIEGLELGADEYVTKPFHPRELLARVRSLARLQRLQAELAARNASLEHSNALLASAKRELEVYGRAVSHDLRSPLVAAGEALRLALAAREPQRARLLELTGANLAQADRMLLGLRDLMRTVGRPGPPRAVELGPLVEGVVDELRAAHGGGDLPIALRSRLAPVEGEPAKLAHVFRNLLANALEHTRHRAEPRIEVGHELHGDQVLVYVADNGTGVPFEYQSRIFEPFRRGPRASGDGLGLGLALVQQIVQQHGGKVWIESSPGAGSVFRCLLPRASAEAAA